MRVVIALGGNALLRRGERPDAAVQATHLATAAPALVRMARAHQVVFVHGNGPQVGVLARESAADTALTAPFPLSLLTAATQGLIGALLQAALRDAGLHAPTVTVLTHTLIDPADPAFHTPDKFVGESYDRAHAIELGRRYGWSMAEDGGRWRRVVPSPRPLRVLEIDTIRALAQTGVTVIAGGGGGIPLRGGPGPAALVDAVVDKDYTAALLAREIGADLLLILSDVPGVLDRFGSPMARVIPAMTPLEARDLDLPAGSMRPKVDAAAQFTLATGKPAVIGALEDAEEAVAGRAGTRIQRAG
ncbi:carbamate kinase [Humibacter sp. BT305]|nr:carbamate kinase [Humibacter sp. BT305]